jgi:hypothetical protein
MFEGSSGEEFNLENEHSEYKKLVEKEFLASLQRGEDISKYLYVPVSLLSQTVKDHLDIFLLEKAYENLFVRKHDTWTVYSDTYMNVFFSDDKAKIEILQRMLEHFQEREEYEKCSLIKKEIDTLQT